MTATAPYDPTLRRDTPLALKLKALIRARGPMPVRDYMGRCLNDREHGYYRTRTGIGRAGDFVTAPEISQVFGELIGLWAVTVWQQMGCPRPFSLLELGPGRGTMMRDALRAAALVPAFLEAAEVLLAEPNEAFHTVQRQTLRDVRAPIQHISDDPPQRPTIVLANEVLDCLAVTQLVRGTDDDGGDAWRVRMVALEADNHLVFAPGRARRLRPGADDELPKPSAGDILEDRNARGITEGLLGALGRTAPLAALFIDYGHQRSAYGDTLQAVRNHAPEHPLTSPGEADLTAHVDFQGFASLVREVRDQSRRPTLAADGPVPQATFLGRLGIIERTSRLMAANPARAAEIEAGVARLMAPGGMGTRFQAIGVRSAALPRLPGFEE